MDQNELLGMITEAKGEFGDDVAVMVGEICVAAARFGKWVVDNNYPMPSNGEEGLALLFKLFMDDDEAFNKAESWIEEHSELFETMKEDLKEEDKESGD